jgi:hypothetical protein
MIGIERKIRRIKYELIGKKKAVRRIVRWTRVWRGEMIGIERKIRRIKYELIGKKKAVRRIVRWTRVWRSQTSRWSPLISCRWKRRWTSMEIWATINLRVVLLRTKGNSSP